MSVELGPRAAQFGQHRPGSGEVGPTSAKSGAMSAKSGHQRRRSDIHLGRLIELRAVGFDISREGSKPVVCGGAGAHGRRCPPFTLEVKYTSAGRSSAAHSGRPAFGGVASIGGLVRGLTRGMRALLQQPLVEEAQRGAPSARWATDVCGVLPSRDWRFGLTGQPRCACIDDLSVRWCQRCRFSCLRSSRVLSFAFAQASASVGVRFPRRRLPVVVTHCGPPLCGSRSRSRWNACPA